MAYLEIHEGRVYCYLYHSTERKALWEDYLLKQALTSVRKVFLRGRPTIQEYTLYDPRRRRFPAGLYPRVEAHLKAQDVQIIYKNRIGERLEVKDDPELSEPLYDYQNAAVMACLKHRRGIVQLPTGSGKTRVGIALARMCAYPTLFVVPGRSLGIQTRRLYERLTGQPAGILGEGAFKPEIFTVASMDTLAKRLAVGENASYLQSQGCLILDEVHTMAAPTRYAALMKLSGPVYRIGLSATASGRSDLQDDKIQACTGPIIYKASISSLQEQNVLSKAGVIFYKFPGAQSQPVADWKRVYDDGIVHEDTRNRAIIRICKVTPTPTIVFFERKYHGYILLNMLKRAGLTAEIVHGGHDAKVRTDLQNKLDNSEIDVLLASRVFNQGVDIPSIKSAVNAAGYKASIASMQKIGRPMRITEEKRTFIFWELVDSHNRILLEHSRERYRTYKQAGLWVATHHRLSEAVADLAANGFLGEDAPRIDDSCAHATYPYERPFLSIHGEVSPKDGLLVR